MLYKYRVNRHEARIDELEHLNGPARKTPRLLQQANAEGGIDTPPNASVSVSSDNENLHVPRGRDYVSPGPQTIDYSLNQLELGAPIATLRSLGALTEQRELRHGPIRSGANLPASLDPIGAGILTEGEALRACDM